ncbi:MAG: hypothetical protein COV59_04950 [Candidatus Magasanikbacteria bacterium CG11_big_fil_rev_8_21_14_0_20_39_34]|uniref:Endolytic murein transglycosylase n=1 Tax=Candidatus Magasanikbacteria bacterium CG11_big_fil_rev_8_21_14_0_20_39_34 TaxID=1974653 RepID=A0A2H0N3N6_9BACT|nr:MAG: hypothetical protein COV59_04950 [Candidatus Magasanikbacteria bacterium CG11_big_fil_rev_8_21_14_0_20_39_34]
MKIGFHKWTLSIVGICIIFCFFFLYSEIYSKDVSNGKSVSFELQQNQTVSELAAKLEEKGIIRFSGLFKKYIVFRGVDKTMQPGVYRVEPPVTLARIVDALKNTRQNREEISLTILPGWNLKDIAAYFEKQNIAKEEEVYTLLGHPAQKTKFQFPIGDIKLFKDVPRSGSLEGYLAPETVRFYSDVTLEEVIEKFLHIREAQFSDQMLSDIKKQEKSIHDILTMASILEREVKHPEDRAMVANLFWRRLTANWALQADSTVHYAVEREDKQVFTTDEQRKFDSPWNTYKYPGLPPTPISIPSIDSIMAAIYPTQNSYWFFLTTLDTGEVKFSKTLEEHNAKVQKYLR